MAGFDKSIKVERVLSGKLRRYHHLTWWQHLTIPSVLFPNIVDVFFIVFGIIQSIVKLIFWRPDVVFTKGGAVCVPIGVAAKLLGIPIAIHDSDAHPGLTNQILGKWATAIGTGAPLEYYSYPKAKTHYIGTPVDEAFRPLSDTERQVYKAKLGFDPTKPLVVVTGGGLGAKRINDAIVKRLSSLLEVSSVLLISGVGQYDELRAITPEDDVRFQLHAFVSTGMAGILGCADVVVARAGATTLLELAAVARPTIIVPNGNLTGGHQLKNAEVYESAGAVEVVSDREIEANPQLLIDAINVLLANPAKQQQMTKLFHAMAKPNAASDMADLIEHIGAGRRR